MQADNRSIGAIVAMNRDRVIGRDGDLPWHYPADLKRFKRKTLDTTVIMGRKTWESIGSRPLPRRRNIVISSGRVPGAECYDSLAQAIGEVDGDIWIIGGGQLYRHALEYCDAVDVTWVPDSVTGDGLVRFIELDPAHWQAGAPVVNTEDPRLVHQLFRRIAATGNRRRTE